MNSRTLGWVLVLLLAAQVAVYATVRTKSSRRPAPAELQLGARFRSVLGITEGNGRTRTPLTHASRYTVVLAYDPRCVHSTRIADAWKRWLDSSPRARVLAVARGTHPTAAAYARQQGWRMRTVAVSTPARGTLEHSLLRRTPWVFVFDSQGTLRFQGHGSELAAVDSLVAGRHPAARSALRSFAARTATLGFTEIGAPLDPRSGGGR